MTAVLNPGRPFAGGERELLEDTLNLNRAELVRAVEDLSDAEAHERRVPSFTVEHHIVGTVSLRFIYLVMIAEVARHAGHADILAEQIRAHRR
ncbi:DUF664 domain-containing protein [Mycolicibacterium cosmeticum]|uniref:DinB superfamily protein n=1 Tax=Mycolicibacterium cosmeticum TaxID=258533 RepID=W9AZE7_MYCCO|nr:DUF664 domain-containing protein [Mycolicibacterium cosmeticum]TLH74004.1 DUF664 domain-containing protein [Mycolicibacterium cosmeticum]CDO10923.1 hypothetical protein BN977_05764 [Mycolicibacterium cosmeticum]